MWIDRWTSAKLGMYGITDEVSWKNYQKREKKNFKSRMNCLLKDMSNRRKCDRIAVVFAINANTKRIVDVIAMLFFSDSFSTGKSSSR